LVIGTTRDLPWAIIAWLLLALWLVSAILCAACLFRRAAAPKLASYITSVVVSKEPNMIEKLDLGDPNEQLILETRFKLPEALRHDGGFLR
jgi:hypothetical protein